MFLSMNTFGRFRSIMRYCTVVSAKEEMDHTRYYKNPYGDFSNNANSFLNGNKLKSDLLAKIKGLDDTLFNKLDNFVKRLPRNHEHSVYTGYCGIAHLYLMKYKKTRNNNYLQTAKSLTDKAMDLLRGRDISFLLGDAGPLTLAAIIYHHLGSTDEVDTFVKRLLDLPNIVQDPPYEILYGYAGYLYALLYLNKEIGPVIPKENIQQVIRIILEGGRDNAQAMKFSAPLYYDWFETNYLGAAHGVSGILYMLLCANDYLSTSDKDDLIRPTIDWLSQERFPSTNFKSSEGRDRDALVHWCHGSPGVAYLYLLASKVFNCEEYSNIAVQCGEVVWNRGLLKKGYSLCHGVSGNCYTFIHLYKETNDVNYLYRAACFADWCTKYPEAEGHKPDSPFSLFEGIAGLDYFLSDIQDLSTAAFPAFALA